MLADTMVNMRPELNAIHEVWARSGTDGLLPSRADIGPERLKPWLRNIALIDIEPAPLRFRRRLVGTKIVDYQGADQTGQYLAEQEMDAIDSWDFDDYLLCAKLGSAMHRCESSIDPSGNTIRWERLLLPLAKNGSTPDMILVGLYRDAIRRRPSLPAGLEKGLHRTSSAA